MRDGTGGPAVPVRRRGSELDGHLRQVTAALLHEVGYRALTIEAVAARAGVAKTSVYRRWPTKASLVGELLTDLAVDHGRDAAGDDPGQLRDAARRLAGLFADPAFSGAVLGVLLDADAAEVVRLRTALMGGRPGDPGLPSTRNAVLGAVVLRGLVMRLPVDDDWLRALFTEMRLDETTGDRDGHED